MHEINGIDKVGPNYPSSVTDYREQLERGHELIDEVMVWALSTPGIEITDLRTTKQLYGNLEFVFTLTIHTNNEADVTFLRMAYPTIVVTADI